MAGSVFNPQPQEIAGNVQTVAPVTDRSNLIREQESLRQQQRSAQVTQQAISAIPGVVGAVQEYRSTKAVNEFTGGVSHLDEIIPDARGLEDFSSEEERQEAIAGIGNLQDLIAARKSGAISYKEMEMKAGTLLRQTKRNAPYAANKIEAAYNKLIYGTGSGALRQQSSRETEAQKYAREVEFFTLANGGDSNLGRKYADAARNLPVRNLMFEQKKRDGSLGMQEINQNIKSNANAAMIDMTAKAQEVYKNNNGTIPENSRLAILNSTEAGIQEIMKQHQDAVAVFRQQNPGLPIPESMQDAVEQEINNIRRHTDMLIENRSYSQFVENVIKEVDNVEQAKTIKDTGVVPSVMNSPHAPMVFEAIGQKNDPFLQVLKSNPATAPLVNALTQDPNKSAASIAIERKLQLTNTIFEGTPAPNALNPPPPVTSLALDQATEYMAWVSQARNSVPLVAATVEQGGDALERMYSSYSVVPEGIVHLNKDEYKALVAREPSVYQPVYKEMTNRALEDVGVNLLNAPAPTLNFEFNEEGQITGLSSVTDLPPRNQIRTSQTVKGLYKVAKNHPFIYKEDGFDNPEDWIRNKVGLVTFQDLQRTVDDMPAQAKSLMEKFKNNERMPRAKDILEEINNPDLDANQRDAIKEFVNIMSTPGQQDIAKRFMNIDTSPGQITTYSDRRNRLRYDTMIKRLQNVIDSPEFRGN